MSLKARFKYLMYYVVDVAIICFCLLLSFWLRVGQELLTVYFTTFMQFLALYIPTRLVIFQLTGVYRIFWRYVSAQDAMKIARAVVMSSMVMLAISFLVEMNGLPRSVFVMEMIVTTLGVLGSRMFRRYLFESSFNQKVKNQGQRTLIYGAGFNGRTLVKRFKQDYSMRTHVVGYVDDDPTKKGKSIEGVRVLGAKEDLESILQTYRIEHVIISITDPSGELVRDILLITKKRNIKPQIISTKSSKNANILRTPDLSDLLNRPQRHVDFSSIRKLIENKIVLVTGAGGSIGSELARQIWNFNPQQILLMDHNEYSLYKIDNELRLDPKSSHKVVPLLIDLKDKASVDAALEDYSPSLVFHAAAYKHVHLVQTNPYSSILNNVYGTRILLEACQKIDVDNFILVSTDNAVNPVGVMGATKRICEIMTSVMGFSTNKNYCSVRFGNVLGSSGSLVPLLEKQIKEGGPVTVTHKDVTRYFMLIPEAVSLVLNAAVLSKPGDLQVLKMGDPLKILDIVRGIIVSMGFTEEEIPIEFIGLRPGEKMFEELYISGDELKTDNPDILTVPNGDNLTNFESQEQLKIVTDRLAHQLCEWSNLQDKKALTLLNSVAQQGLKTYIQSDMYKEMVENEKSLH
ncbi:MAG: polysaccharide biosynthesis protein [Bdellovibrionales bacterium]|nr:polysaccharide biosynthesis protein [Bdellovibrionales bacterium]NQZ19963.1 polysaccharide biosynthesis protein [Bdellovibrionales bacterium]